MIIWYFCTACSMHKKWKGRYITIMVNFWFLMIDCTRYYHTVPSYQIGSYQKIDYQFSDKNYMWSFLIWPNVIRSIDFHVLWRKSDVQFFWKEWFANRLFFLLNWHTAFCLSNNALQKLMMRLFQQIRFYSLWFQLWNHNRNGDLTLEDLRISCTFLIL